MPGLFLVCDGDRASLAGERMALEEVPGGVGAAGADKLDDVVGRILTAQPFQVVGGCRRGGHHGRRDVPRKVDRRRTHGSRRCALDRRRSGDGGRRDGGRAIAVDTRAFAALPGVGDEHIAGLRRPLCARAPRRLGAGDVGAQRRALRARRGRGRRRRVRRHVSPHLARGGGILGGEGVAVRVRAQQQRACAGHRQHQCEIKQRASRRHQASAQPLGFAIGEQRVQRKRVNLTGYAAGVLVNRFDHRSAERAVAHQSRVAQAHIEIIAALLHVERLEHDHVNTLRIVGRDSESSGLGSEQQAKRRLAVVLRQTENPVEAGARHEVRIVHRQQGDCAARRQSVEMRA